MTREEAVKALRSGEIVATTCDMKDYTEAREMAIKALEQEPCEDAVCRKALIEHNNISNIRQAVMQTPSATHTRSIWIPVSERQPAKNGNYLAFYRSGDGTATIDFMMVDHCNAGGGWLHEESGKKFYKKVLAWMPLPEPYKAEVRGGE